MLAVDREGLRRELTLFNSYFEKVLHDASSGVGGRGLFLAKDRESDFIEGTKDRVILVDFVGDETGVSEPDEDLDLDFAPIEDLLDWGTGSK